ncbi:MAG: glycosyltransferase [Sphaerochaetaceae bacterium]|nr:glycosyltransferase [Sphaerochaetaceae bacterium]
MNIALLSGSFLPTLGGAEVVVDSLAKEFVKKGHNVAVFTETLTDKQDYECNFDYDVYRFPYNAKYCMLQKNITNVFNKKMLLFKPDVIHSFLCGCSDWMGIKYGKKYNIPTFFTAQTNWKYIYQQRSPFKSNAFLNRLYVNAFLTGPAKFIKNVDYTTSVCKSVVYSQSELWGDRIKDNVVIYNGYNKESIMNETVKDQDISANEAFKLCYAGRVSDEKNLLFSFNVCKELKKQNRLFVFYIAGSGKIEEYKKLAYSLDIQDNVRFLGRLNLNELSSIYRKSDVFLFPSVFDCDSIACIESRLCGCPTLCVKNTGTSERIIDGQNGFALEENVDEFVKKIVELINMKSMDSDSYLNLRATTTSLAADTWRNVSEQYLHLYQKAIDEDRR